MEILSFMLAIVLFVAFEAFFAGSEIALVSADRNKVLALYRKTKQGFLKDFYDNPEDYITLTMLGYTVSIVFASTFYTLLLLKLGEHLGFIKGFEALLSGTLVIFTLVAGEILPKSLFQKHADRLLVPSLWLLSKLRYPTKPLLVFARGLSRLITERVKERAGESLSKEDLLGLMEGCAQEEELRIALRVLNMKEVMVAQEAKPIKEVVMVEERSSVGHALSVMKGSGYKRLLVYKQRVDQIVGYVDLYDLVSSRHARSIRELVRPIHYFSEFTTLEKVFETFVKSGEKVGVVVDERGNPLGIITWEDIKDFIFELYGEQEEQEEEVVEVEKDRWIINAELDRESFERLFGVELPEGPYNTVGGFVSFYLKRLPKKGERIKVGEYSIKVLQADERRVTKLMVEKHVSEGQEAKGAS